MYNIAKIETVFSDKIEFEHICPTCKNGFLVPDQTTFKVIEPIHSQKLHADNAWDPNWVTHRFTITCICNKKECGEIAFVSGHGGVDHRYNYDDQGDYIDEYYNYFTIKSFTPSPPLCHIPPETPEKVTYLLDKSFSLFWVSTSAASNSLRASMEALLDELKVPKKVKNKSGTTTSITLHRRLEIWADTENEFAELCFALKDIGNIGSHGEVVTQEHYKGALEIYSHILKELFDNNSKKMKKLAQSIRDDIKSNNLI